MENVEEYCSIVGGGFERSASIPGCAPESPSAFRLSWSPARRAARGHPAPRPGAAPLGTPIRYRFSSPARRAAGVGRHPCTPGPGLRPWEPQFDASECRGLGAHAWGILERAAAQSMFRHNEGIHQCIDHATDIICRGSGGPPAHPAGSARGGARSHAHERTYRVSQRGAREAEPARIHA